MKCWLQWIWVLTLTSSIKCSLPRGSRDPGVLGPAPPSQCSYWINLTGLSISDIGSHIIFPTKIFSSLSAYIFWTFSWSTLIEITSFCQSSCSFYNISSFGSWDISVVTSSWCMAAIFDFGSMLFEFLFCWLIDSWFFSWVKSVSQQKTRNWKGVQLELLEKGSTYLTKENLKCQSLQLVSWDLVQPSRRYQEALAYRSTCWLLICLLMILGNIECEVLFKTRIVYLAAWCQFLGVINNVKRHEGQFGTVIDFGQWWDLISMRSIVVEEILRSFWSHWKFNVFLCRITWTILLVKVWFW